MAAEIKIVNPLDMPDWDQNVLKFEDYSFFHSRCWASVVANTYGYRPLYFTLWKNKKLCAIIPLFEVFSLIFGKKGVSLPFTDHCSPIISDRHDFDLLFRSIIKYGKQSKWRKIKIKGGGPYLPDAPKSEIYNLHMLKLESDETALMKRFRNSTKRNIKKAVKKNLSITIGIDLKTVKEFYHLNCITRKHHGVPPQPFKFFHNIYKYVLKEEKGMVIIARYQRKPVAGGVFFHFGRKAMYKYGASRRDALDFRPNNFVMWQAIKWYGKNGFEQFDMGRSEPENIGLNQFKNGWGTKVKKLPYYTFNIAEMTFSGKEKGITSNTAKIFRKMPVAALRIVGELAYKHMG